MTLDTEHITDNTGQMAHNSHMSSVIGHLSKESSAAGHVYGFTLVELLIVIFVMALIAGVGGDVMISTFRSSNKANIINEINQNANFVLSTVESVARNGKCSYMSGTNLIIVDQYNQVNTFSFGTGAQCGAAASATCVLKSVGAGTASSLTNTNSQNGVAVVGASSSFEVVPVGATCATKSPMINVSLTLQQAPGASLRTDYQALSTFKKSIEIRNY